MESDIVVFTFKTDTDWKLIFGFFSGIAGHIAILCALTKDDGYCR